MKNRIIVTNKEDIDFIETYKNVDYTKEQVPETWEELKDLCKKYNGKGLFVANWYIEVGGALVYSNVLFTNDGAIFLNTDCCFKEKATPAQMWQIIKNLIGE